MKSPEAELRQQAKMFNRAAEVATIGAILLDPSCFVPVAKRVGPDSFAHIEHQIIFQCLLDLKEDETPIDLVILRDRLERTGQLEKVGGVEYLKKIIDGTVSAANAEYYADITQERSLYRFLVKRVEAMQEVLDQELSTKESVEEMQRLSEGFGTIINASETTLVWRTMDTVEPQEIKWLWRDMFPIGMVSIIQGDSGAGKSYLTQYLASKVSNGSVWPEHNENIPTAAPKGTTILLSPEDDAATTIRPRLDVMGADHKNIIIIESARHIGLDGAVSKGYFDLKQDLPELRKLISRRGDVKLLVIDPLNSFMGAKTDTHRDSDVRNVLMPLIELANKSNVAVICCVHLNKNTLNTKSLYRGMGSVAYNASARMCWLLSRDLEDPDSPARLLTPVKYNLIKKPLGLSFQINDDRTLTFNSEPVTMSSDEALGAEKTVLAPKKEAAVEFLNKTLTPGKAISTAELHKLSKENGISEFCLKQAKAELGGIKTYPLRQPNGKNLWFWELKNE